MAASLDPSDQSAPLEHNRRVQPLSLRLILIVPFVLQVFATVGLVGYLSFRNGQKAVMTLADRLEQEVVDRVDQHLDTFLALPQQINHINQDAVQLGLLNPQDVEGSGQYFWRQLQHLPSISYINYASTTGEFAGAGRWLQQRGTIDLVPDGKTGKEFVYSTDDQGRPTRVLQTYDYDPRQESWYREAMQAKRPVWSNIFAEEGVDYIAISTMAPMVDRQNRVVGVLGVDLLLTGISDFLRNLRVSATGKVFIIERDGLLVAHSDQSKPYSLVRGTPQRIRVLDHPNPRVKATAQFLQRQFGDFRQIKTQQQLDFTVDGAHQFVHVMPWQDQFGLDWLVVTVVPESDFMAQIEANNRTTLLLCLAALGSAVLLGVYTSRWITRPISRLGSASRLIASGELGQRVEASGIRELEVLRQSFNQMAAQLQTSFEELELRVDQRTAELKAAKETAEQAKQIADSANRAKSNFLANMSHELRTPLNGILGYAQILQRDPTVSERHQEDIEIIYQCGSHLLMLINDVLDLAKIEAGKLELFIQKFDLAELLTGVVEVCRMRAQQKGIEFVYTPASNLPAIVLADAKGLRQVLLNLLGNAIKFTDQGSVVFQVEQTDQAIATDGETAISTLRFTVQDTGSGIQADQLEQIFLPFEQVGDRARMAEGTGLGLAISQRLVHLMGSELEVQSQIGQGSRFWFEVDLPVVEDLLMAEPFELLPTGYMGDRCRILIVDDRWENRVVMTRLLQPLGFEVREACNGLEGLDQAMVWKPDLIITDLSMPVMDGLEMVKQLRRQPDLQDTVILATSATVMNSNRQQCKAVGCQGFVPKPVNAVELLDQLQTYLALQWIYQTPAAPQMVTISEDTAMEGSGSSSSTRHNPARQTAGQ
jgi:signal transduction histidine kinase/DNA-binding NarL/FixJ family response regulator